MDLTPKQQTSEAIRQADTILVMTGQHPSIDQVAAVIGLALILRSFGKRVSAVISDSLPQAINLLDSNLVERNFGGLRDFILKLDTSKAQVDKLRYEVIDGKLHVFVTPFRGNFAPSDVTFDYGEPQFAYDIAIVLGVPTRARIDKIYEQNQAMFAQVPIVNLDFHRSNENYGAINLIEPNASSLCEMLVALAESLQGGIIDAEIATALLMGIIASTDRFTAAHTTSKSLTVAAQMMAAGAKQQAVVKALYRDNRSDNRAGNHQAGEQRSTSDRQDRSSRQMTPDSRKEHQPQQGRPQVTANPMDQTMSREEPTAELRDRELPIIEPSHIEMSEHPNDNGNDMRRAEAGLPSTPNPPDRSPYAGPLPQMADFAAAAEILARRQADDADRDANDDTAA